MKLIQFILVLFAASSVFADEANRPDVLASVDLKAFDGTYYEIASLPQESKKYCYQDSQISFELLRNGQELDVIRTCLREDGLLIKTSGRAKSDSPTNNKLRLAYVHITDWIWSLADNAWFLAADENYQWVVLADPDRDEAWIYSRTPSLNPGVLSELAKLLKDQGYNHCELLMTRNAEQSFNEQPRLCDVAQ